METVIYLEIEKRPERERERDGSRSKYAGYVRHSIKTKGIRLMASSGWKARERVRWAKEVVQPRKSGRHAEERNAAARLLKYLGLKPPKGVLLTVTSIQRAQGPGDARPPENCGHVTDPPHPDPWNRKHQLDTGVWTPPPSFFFNQTWNFIRRNKVSSELKINNWFPIDRSSRGKLKSNFSLFKYGKLTDDLERCQR